MSDRDKADVVGTCIIVVSLAIAFAAPFIWVFANIN